MKDILVLSHSSYILQIHTYTNANFYLFICIFSYFAPIAHLYKFQKSWMTLTLCTSVSIHYLIFQVKKFITLKKSNKDNVLIYTLKPPPKIKSGVRWNGCSVCFITWHPITMSTTLLFIPFNEVWIIIFSLIVTLLSCVCAAVLWISPYEKYVC